MPETTWWRFSHPDVQISRVVHFSEQSEKEDKAKDSIENICKYEYQGEKVLTK